MSHLPDESKEGTESQLKLRIEKKKFNTSLLNSSYKY
jgi:hypothetical protein